MSGEPAATIRQYLEDTKQDIKEGKVESPTRSKGFRDCLELILEQAEEEQWVAVSQVCDRLDQRKKQLQEEHLGMPDEIVAERISELERLRERLNEEAGEKAKEEGRVGRPKTELPVEDIVDEWEKGFPVTRLAEKYDVSRDTIYDRLKERGAISDE